MRITKKELKQNYNYIIRAGYCELYNITREAREIGNASGVYGWNWTAYEIEATNGEPIAICTGYRDMTGDRVEGLQKFENKAKEIAGEYYSKYSCDWNKYRKAQKRNAQKMADYFIQKIKEQRNKGAN